MDDSTITSACLTIDHLANHFDRLKGRVDDMVATFGASQRGHFTPDQDDEARNLLVSYCQSRTALLDLVHQVLAEKSSPEAADRVALLIGYDGVGGIRFHLTRRSGRLTLSAEDLLRMAVRGEYFEPLAVYAPDYRKRLCTGGDAKKALEATL